MSGFKTRQLYGIEATVKENITLADFMHRKNHVQEKERARARANLERHKIERFHGSLRRELLNDNMPFADLAAAQADHAGAGDRAFSHSAGGAPRWASSLGLIKPTGLPSGSSTMA